MLVPIELPDEVAKEPQWIEYAERLHKTGLKYVTPLSDPVANVELPKFEVVCEMCNAKPSVLYCDQDKAHLCSECDESHHKQSKLLMKHSRLPVHHSPFQFGFCSEHTSDRYECVCLDCGVMLCQLCLLVGSHAQLTDHPIISTIEAFRLSLTPPDSELIESVLKRSSISSKFFALKDMKLSLIDKLKAKHALVVQAEGNQFSVQQILDKNLRAVTETLKRIRTKRIEYLEALRRENLLLLTITEWMQAFSVHARLSLPPSLWLVFFNRVEQNNSFFRSLVLGTNREMKPVDLVSEYMDSLPRWLTRRIDIVSNLEAYVDDVFGASNVGSSSPVVQSKFEWVPPTATEFDVAELSPDRLRQNRMTARLEELLSKPQEPETTTSLFKSLPVINEPVPLDNVHDFVMQTLAVLAESENQIPDLSFPEDLMGPREADRAQMPSQAGSVDEVGPAQAVLSAPQSKPPTRRESVGAGLPPPRAEMVPQDQAQKLKRVLTGGSTVFENAVSVLVAAPSGERQELIRSFMYLFREDSGSLEALIKAICKWTVDNIESSNFLVSGISMLVPLTATFQLALYPSDSVFLDKHVQDLIAKAFASSSVSDPTTFAESLITKFISLISQPSTGIQFPSSIRFLLRTIHSACAVRFSAQVSIGVVTGLFLARIVSPRLLFCAPKSSSDIQAPQVITLMTRFIHRIAGAAAEGQTAFSTVRTDDPLVASINTAISQTNGLISRCILSVPTESLPALSGGLSPRSAAAKIDRKLEDYGHTIRY